jgi:uncharacterized protein YodC (DUF2158 family)
MSSAPFKPGDTVRLKSGGPAMTVVAVEGERITCDWFEGSQKYEATFPAAALDLDNSSTNGASARPQGR